MKRFMVPRMAHCGSGHTKVMGTTENYLLRWGWNLRHEEGKTMAKDPVCGMQVDEKKAAASSVFKGTTYYFCAPACKVAFDKSPEKFIGKPVPGS